VLSTESHRYSRLGRCAHCIVATTVGLLLSWTAVAAAILALPPNSELAFPAITVAVTFALSFTLLGAMHAGAHLARRSSTASWNAEMNAQHPAPFLGDCNNCGRKISSRR
jgi:hypothetical protein